MLTGTSLFITVSPATTAPLSSLSVPALVLLHVHHADRHDGMVSGLDTISCAGSCCRCHCWVAVLCSSWVRRINYRACARIFSSLALHNRPPTHLLCRIPIAFDLLVLKRQWKSFITWSVVALLLVLVRKSSFPFFYFSHNTLGFLF